jgi:choline dehydrogenase-like flavoprotein
VYDYLIIGAGSAGCVFAARLSEDADVRVLLVEAGPPDTAEEIHIPLALGHLIQTKWDWDYRTGAEPGRPQQVPPVRQDARRLLVDERDDLYSRPPRRL